MNLSAEIDMEDYILGISEMPYFWGSTGGMEALEAQAVAARSYAYHRVIQRGDPADRPWCWCHIYDTTVDQYYVGWGHGTQEWVDAVANTDGKIMTHPSETRDGALIPIQTFYSSSTYGVTENSEDGFIAYVPYLRSVDDHWSQDPAVGNHSARWTRTFTGGQLAASLPGMATVTGVEITKCSPSGAALQITFQGQGGPRAYATRELRGRLALKSMQVLAVGAPTPGASPCGDPGADPGTEGGPAALLAISIDDDTVGDSFGNGDGLAQCGETVEVFTTVGTDGDAITGVGMTISSSDPHVTVAWNTTSDAVDIPVGGSATNAGDWDLTIGNGAQDAHEATLVLVVTADNGGPWTLDVPLPISCGRTRGDAAAGLTDVNANGTADVAVALTNSSGRSRVIVKDGATGRRIATTSLGRSTVLHLEPVADLGRSPAPDLAALVVNSRGGRIVILDSATGARVESHSLPRSRSPVDLDVVGDGPNSMLVVTSQSPTRTFVDTYSAVSGDPISSFRIPLRLTVADVEGLRAPDGESVVGVLVAYPGGRTAVLLFDAATGEPAGSVRFSRKGAPVDLEAAVDGAGVRLVTTFMAGPDVVVESRGLSGVRHSVAVVGRGTVVDVESLPNVGGTPTPDIAVLVVDSGIARAIVVDPASGSVIASPSYPAGLDPIDLAVISGGGATRLAVLGNLSRGARVSLSSPTGTGLETISVP